MQAGFARTDVRGPNAQPVGAPLRRLVEAGRAALQTYFASVLPAVLFGYVTWARLTGLVGPDGQLRDVGLEGDGLARLHSALELVHFVLGTLFMGLVAVMFLVRRPSLRQRRSLAGDAAAVAGTVSVMGLTAAPRTVDSLGVLVVASLLVVAGMAIMLLALGSLGRCFGVMPRARGLVTGGPYRYIRHPMYLGEFVAFGGTLLTVLSPLTITVYGAFVALQLYRVSWEERTLAAAFPEHAAYRAATSRLLPGLY